MGGNKCNDIQINYFRHNGKREAQRKNKIIMQPK